MATPHGQLWGRTMCRLDPATSWDLGRGHLGSVLDCMVSKTPSLSSAGLCAELEFMEDRFAASVGAPPTKFVASRLGMPEVAAHVPLEEWLPADVHERFLAPPPSGTNEEDAAPRFFDATMEE